MANYAIIDYTTPLQFTVSDATALIEVYLETIDNTKTLHAVNVLKQGEGFVGYVIHNA